MTVIGVPMTAIDAWCDDSVCGVSHRIIYCVLVVHRMPQSWESERLVRRGTSD